MRVQTARRVKARRRSRHTLDAVRVLGLEIARARRAQQWTMGRLAERTRVSVPTVRKVERGDPSVSIGTVFEMATLLGVPLFDTDRSGVRGLREDGHKQLALLPSRVLDPEGTDDE